ncbi:hypothetical protein QUA62_28430 [Microcoleus sp. MON1_C1]|uniref:hypothetical protein n=1 Tax=Microcoleus sp. MON1_C1 TaxID=2818827 RepID=UPI002FD39842
MTIPSVVNGCIQTDDKKFNGIPLADDKGRKWVETINSFRYEPIAGGGNKPFTARKESTKSGDYWYGYRKMGGKLHKKYIGKTSEICFTLLETIGKDLNTPPQPRVAEVTEKVTDTASQRVTEVIGNCDAGRLTALELQVQALQESLEALRRELPGKSDSGNSEELPTVAESELQNDLSNLKAENEALRQEFLDARADYAKLLEISSHIKADREKQIADLRSQLGTERADREELETELADLKQNSEIDFDYAGKAGELVSWLRKVVGRLLPKEVTVKAVQKILQGSGDN